MCCLREREGGSAAGTAGPPPSRLRRGYFVVSPPLVPVDPPVEPGEPVEPAEPGESLVPIPLPLVPVPVPAGGGLPMPLEPVLPVAPADVMSTLFAFTVLPEPEKLARTSSPSLMSSREALEPSFITFVLESSLIVLSLPERVNVFFERSNFSTLPWSELPAVADVSLVEPVLEVP